MLKNLVMFKMSMVKSVCLCHRQPASAIYRYCMCLSQTLCVYHRQFVSVPYIFFVTYTELLKAAILQSQNWEKYLRICANLRLTNTKQEKLSINSCVGHNLTKFFFFLFDMILCHYYRMFLR